MNKSGELYDSLVGKLAKASPQGESEVALEGGVEQVHPGCAWHMLLASAY